MNALRVDVPHLVAVRGAGDLATGVIQKVIHAGFRVVALEAIAPSAIRWRAALSTAVGRGLWPVEDLVGIRVSDWAEAEALLDTGVGARHMVPVLPDPDARLLARVRPLAVIDAVLAKRNLGTHRAMAPVTVGCGPGFVAGEDVDFVVETKRGHELGRVITSGAALPNTGVPGMIAGRASERVIHSPTRGIVRVVRDIGDVAQAGEVVCRIESDAEGTEGIEMKAPFTGVIRGMIPDGFVVTKGFKIADLDPRLEMATACDTISDKARSVGGGALDALLQGLVMRGYSMERHVKRPARNADA